MADTATRRWTSHLASATVNGRPVSTAVLTLARQLWTAGDAKAVYTAYRAVRTRMRHHHTAYPRRWRQP